jgi:plastocyanin
MRLRAGIVAAACAAVLALPATAAARTQIVWAGGPAAFQAALGSRYGAEANDFFPHATTIHVGDTISWKGLSSGFHNVDLPGRSGSDLTLITPTGKTVTGVNDAAGNPFWFDNNVPEVGFNPLLFARSGPRKYDGTSRIDSGLPFKPAAFKVTFTKPGTYLYFCDVHYDMRGIIVVKPRSAKAPTAAQLQAAVLAQTARDTKVAAALDKTRVRGKRVNLGAAGKFSVEVLAMFPATLRVARGSIVTFSMPKGTGETHTATFGPTAYLKTLASSFLRPVIDPRAIYPSSPPPQLIPLAATSHGNGFANTGVLDRDAGTPVPPNAAIRFTQPGTYRYICLIHPFMRGTIIVK